MTLLFLVVMAAIRQVNEGGHVWAQQSGGLRDDEEEEDEDMPPLRKQQPSSLAAKAARDKVCMLLLTPHDWSQTGTL